MAESTFQPQRDSYMNGVASDTNYGAANAFSVGTFVIDTTKVSTDRAIINFDVSSLAGQTVTAAQLELNRQDTNNVAIISTLRRCTRPTTWTEAGVTWNKYDGVTAWTTPGGDVDGTPTPVGYTIPAAQGDFTVTGLAAMVQDAIDNRAGILSLIWRADDEAPGIVHQANIYSKEDPVNHQHLLRVTYVGAAAPWLMGFWW